MTRDDHIPLDGPNAGDDHAAYDHPCRRHGHQHDMGVLILVSTSIAHSINHSYLLLSAFTSSSPSIIHRRLSLHLQNNFITRRHDVVPVDRCF